MPQPSRQWANYGHSNAAIFPLLFWQFMATLVFLCGCVIGFWIVKCFKFCQPLTLSDSIFFLIIFLDLGLLVAIWYELSLWTLETLTINKFLYYQLAKSAYVLPLYVIWQCDVIRSGYPSQVWERVWETFWVPVVFVGPYVATLVIAIVVKVKSGREVSDEETPLLAGEGEAPPPAAALSNEEQYNARGLADR